MQVAFLKNFNFFLPSLCGKKENRRTHTLSCVKYKWKQNKKGAAVVPNGTAAALSYATLTTLMKTSTLFLGFSGKYYFTNQIVSKSILPTNFDSNCIWVFRASTSAFKPRSTPAFIIVCETSGDISQHSGS